MAAQASCALLQLPAELRLNIWELVFAAEAQEQSDRDLPAGQHLASDDKLMPGLLTACQQTYVETLSLLPIIYGRCHISFFGVDQDGHLDEAKQWLTSLGDTAAKNFSHVTLNAHVLTLDEIDMDIDGDGGDGNDQDGDQNRTEQDRNEEWDNLHIEIELRDAGDVGLWARVDMSEFSDEALDRYAASRVGSRLRELLVKETMQAGGGLDINGWMRVLWKCRQYVLDV